MDGFTPTQSRILAILSDGMPHRPAELKMALANEELASMNALRVHLAHIRQKLRPRGEDIVCLWGWKECHRYRHVRLLHSANDGCR
jgi:hypothetical protein